MRNQKGFTLVELMIVIAIISVLASISAPKLSRYISKAKLLDGQIYASHAMASIDEYILTNDHFPTAGEDAAITDASTSDVVSNYALAAGTASTQGTLTLTLASVTGIEAGKTLVYSRSTAGTWSCVSTLPSDVIPDNCTAPATP